MAFKLPENVQETTTTTGTGTIDLAGAVSGSYPLSSQMANGDTTFYVLSDTVDIEVGVGTYSNTSGQQLARTTVIYSTNGNTPVNWAAGTRNVIIGLPGAALASLLDPSAGNGIVTKTGDRTYASKTLHALMLAEPQPLDNLGEVATVGSESVDLDLSANRHFYASMDTADATGTLTFTVSNEPDVSDTVFSFHLTIRKGGRKTVAMPTGYTAAGGVTPAMGTSTSSYDTWMFWVENIGGTKRRRYMLIDSV